MKHPILTGNGYKYYVVVWFVIILVHSSVLYFFYDFQLNPAVLDSLVFNVIFSGVVPGLWFVVMYGGLNKDSYSLLITHIGAASLTLFVWMGLSNLILKAIFVSNTVYLSFLSDTFLWRGIIGCLIYSISVLIFYLIKYYQDMQKRMHRELELQNLLMDTELRMLKSQINPHFIFNSLNSISALTTIKPESAREMVIKLSDFLRYSLGKENSELNTLSQEMDNASLYLEIERVRFGDRLKFEKEIGEGCSEVMVPNLILQPLLENAIKFGVYDNTEDVTIKLECDRTDDAIALSVINTYDREAVPTKGAGVGLENVKKRLNLVYHGKGQVQVKKSDGMFHVGLIIPLAIDAAQ